MSRTVRRVTAFGWTFAHCTLRAGDSFRFDIQRDMEHHERGWNALYTHGRIEWSDRSADRVPGYFSREVQDFVPAGPRTARALEDSQWWCMDARLNDGRVPATLRRFDLAAGAAGELPQGTRLFLLAGRGYVNGVPIRGPRPLHALSGAMRLVAVERMLGFDLGAED